MPPNPWLEYKLIKLLILEWEIYDSDVQPQMKEFVLSSSTSSDSWKKIYKLLISRGNLKTRLQVILLWSDTPLPHTLQNSSCHFAPCLPGIPCCCCNMAVSHQHREVPWLQDMLTTYPVLFCIAWMFSMRFANCKKFHKVLCRTHQIKGQYEL